jgi:hypothetical protein
VAELLETAGDRAFGALMFVFALPNVVPTPPGVSAALGLPLIVLAAHFLYTIKYEDFERRPIERTLRNK